MKVFEESCGMLKIVLKGDSWIASVEGGMENIEIVKREVEAFTGSEVMRDVKSLQ